ncbi:MAG: hypothetical protein MZV65_52295 [Chromatiales bacterium]|nr:hypothetical protein [Chromatiales bacterium]
MIARQRWNNPHRPPAAPDRVQVLGQHDHRHDVKWMDAFRLPGCGAQLVSVIDQQ